MATLMVGPQLQATGHHLLAQPAHRTINEAVKQLSSSASSMAVPMRWSASSLARSPLPLTSMRHLADNRLVGDRHKLTRALEDLRSGKIPNLGLSDAAQLDELLVLRIAEIDRLLATSAEKE